MISILFFLAKKEKTAYIHSCNRFHSVLLYL